MSYAYGAFQIKGEVTLPEHTRDRHMSDAKKKELGLEEFYEHQQKAMEKRLEMVFDRSMQKNAPRTMGHPPQPESLVPRRGPET